MHVDRVITSKTNVVAYVNETVLRVRSSNEYESVCLRVRAHFTVFHFKKGQNLHFRSLTFSFTALMNTNELCSLYRVKCIRKFKKLKSH